MRSLVLTLATVTLTACSASTPHQHEYNFKSTVALDREHQMNLVTIVNFRPAKSRACWPHNRHWHCHN